METEARQQTRHCPACGEEILATARKCKHCQEWLDGHSPQAVTLTGPPVVTEQTSKAWKGTQLAGAILAIVGVIWVCATVGTPDEGAATAGGVLVGLGLLIFCIARIGAWWDHG